MDDETLILELQQLVTSLEAALMHCDVIRQAKGILMARGNVCADEALEHLEHASQRSNVNLFEVAQRITDINQLASRH